MRRLSSLRSNGAVAMSALLLGCRRGSCLRYRAASAADDGRSALSAQHGFDRAARGDREHDDRYTVFAGKRKRCGIHDLEVALDRLVMGQPLESGRGLVGLRVGAVD